VLLERESVSEFKTTLDARLLPECPGIEQWMLLAPLVYYSDILGCDVVVPANFITDFVSFKALNWIAKRPAVVHDYLTSCVDIPFELANEVFKEAMLSVCVNEELCGNMYAAVELFGRSHKTETYTFYK